MTRLIGPDEASRFVYRVVVNGAVFAETLSSVTFFTNSGLTVLANILNIDGSPVPGSVLTTDSSGMLPLFQFPDGVDTIYASVDGGPAWPVYARTDDRLDALNTAVSTLSKPAQYAPSDHNLLSWMFDPALSPGSMSGTSGTLHMARLLFPQAVTVSNLVLYLSSAGATLTSGFVALYSADGTTRLGQSVDVSATQLSSSGLRTIPLTAPVNLAAGTAWAAVYTSGGTPPQYARGSNAGQNLNNVGLTGQNFRWATGATGLTTALPSSVTFTSSATTFWCGVN